MRYDHESILQLITLSWTVHKYMEWYIIKLVAVMKEMKKKVALEVKKVYQRYELFSRKGWQS